MSEVMTKEAYKPLCFTPGTLSEKYYGWRCVHEAPGIRVIRKTFGPFHKTLFMCQAVDDQRLSFLVNDRRFIGATAVAVIRDFSRPPDEAGLSLGGRHFAYKQNDIQIRTSVATFVIDLDESEEVLWSNLEPNSRNRVRRAAKCGVHVRISSQPCKEDLASFLEFYRPLAARVGSDIPEKKMLERMIEAGDLITASALVSNSSVVAVSLIYLCPPHAFEVWAASGRNRIAGAGHLLKWESARWLKTRGLKWYDLGGLATTDTADTLYTFKKSFGGRYISLGSEYQWMGQAAKPVYAIFRQAKRLIRRSPLVHRRGFDRHAISWLVAARPVNG
jgi:lipid II:glycine glycyltransferase (peptidoglycan interpeptide bridge formation enzyme)